MSRVPLRSAVDRQRPARGARPGRTAGGGPVPRQPRPPRAVLAAWAVSSALGATVVAVTASTASSDPAPTGGLAPSTLVHYLIAAAGPGARDLRINGVYGSGQGGAWQFVAHLSWRVASGGLATGETQLPDQAGRTAPGPVLTSAQLADEQRIGWTPAQVQAALRADPALDDAALATVELQTTDAGSAATVCASAESGRGLISAPARCTTYRRDGAAATFRDVLRDQPGAGALSVQRDGHLLE